MGLEDRDWYREEASRAWWREAGRGARRSQPANRSGSGRTGGALIVAVLLSAGISAAAWRGYLPLPSLEIGGGDSRAVGESIVRLGSATGFDSVGEAGREWCLTVGGGERVCATTGSAETGREALTRVLEARGFRVVR